jgi:mono/diheme cytochrome c family protein
LMGGQRIDHAAAERGRKIFVPTCGFCHGNDAMLTARVVPISSAPRWSCMTTTATPSVR